MKSRKKHSYLKAVKCHSIQRNRTKHKKLKKKIRKGIMNCCKLRNKKKLKRSFPIWNKLIKKIERKMNKNKKLRKMVAYLKREI